MSADFEYTSDWFSGNQNTWQLIINHLRPEKILEIGSYEGRSACFLVERAACEKNIEIHCVDTWRGGDEHIQSHINMADVEGRFDRNVSVAQARAPHSVKFLKHKGESDLILSEMLGSLGKDYFDFIYVDGSHQAPDVLSDAIMSFKLLRKGGVLVFDDYLWKDDGPKGQNPLWGPKIAIDAFTNIFSQKLTVIRAALYQLYVMKTED